VTNNGDACTLMIVDNSYKREYPPMGVGAGDRTEVKILSSKDQGWYDFTIWVKGHEAFEQRFAGRIETGRDSISDPYMGNAVPSNA
jgi:phospholipase C